MKVLVTGASGTVGRYVRRRLHQDGYTIISMVRNASRLIPDLHPGEEYFVGDVSRLYDLECAVDFYKPDGIIHCAANKHVKLCEDQPSQAVETNIIGTLNVLKVLENNPYITRCVLISTDKAAQHENVYGVSKYIGERLVREYARRVSARINSLRFGNVFGSAGSVIPIWYSKIKKGENIQLRMYGNEAPKRFGMTPYGAADFVVSIYREEDKFTNGSVVIPDCPIIDIRTLAEVMVDGTSSDIEVQQLVAGETQHEIMYTEEEELYLAQREDVWEICSDLVGGTYIYPNRTTDHKALDFSETQSFYNTIVYQIY